MSREQNTTHSEKLVYAEDRSPVPWWPELTRRRIGVLLLLVAFALGLRLLAMAFLPLIPQEAYYWMYAQHPAFGYFDHPPMVAWVIGLGTAVFGDTEFGVRIIGNLLMIGASLLMYRFGRAWFGRLPGLFSALLLQILPVYFGVGFIATMDSALVFFWMLCMVGLTVALREDRPWGWYVTGCAIGLAMLSKYTGVFLGGGAALAVVAYRPWRRHLRTPHPYLAALLAVFLFSPVILWNAQHDWASFRFQFLSRWHHKAVNPFAMVEFVGYQLLVATPGMLWGAGLLAVRLLRRRHRLFAPRSIVTLAFSVPLLSVMTYKSLRFGTRINWTLPAYLSLLPAVSYWFLARLRQLSAPCMRWEWTKRLAWAATFCVLVNIGLGAYLLAAEPHLQSIKAFGPWEPLARLVEEYEDRLESESGDEPIIVAEGKCYLASILAFYRKPLEQDANTADYTTSQWVFDGRGLGYPYWAKPDLWPGRDCLYLDDDNEDILERLGPHFEEVELVKDPRLQALGKGQYRLAIARRWRGVPGGVPRGVPRKFSCDGRE